ncbi:hypothetical protein ACTMTF_48550 [Nonomuraea sp. ZG12]|uniref:hypothetical protein n=1 Tax=Nonomuraea sp. ZG12 TaxID=3452207 RepID=UPI003F88BB25
MVKNSARKKDIRARQAATGEAYNAARSALDQTRQLEETRGQLAAAQSATQAAMQRAAAARAEAADARAGEVLALLRERDKPA